MRLGVARVVTSDGQYWERRELDDRQIKRQQRRVSRARMASGKRRKKVRVLANTHRRRRVSNHQAVHRFTSRVVRDHDFIALEALNIQRLTASARGTVEDPGQLVQLSADRNRRALAQTWGKIRQQLVYKAEWVGRETAEVDPAFTSRTCSRCGVVAGDPQLTPVFRCGHCGLRGSAAHNAAVNILRAGHASREGGTTGLRPLQVS